MDSNDSLISYTTLAAVPQPGLPTNQRVAETVGRGFGRILAKRLRPLASPYRCIIHPNVSETEVWVRGSIATGYVFRENLCVDMRIRVPPVAGGPVPADFLSPSETSVGIYSPDGPDPIYNHGVARDAFGTFREHVGAGLRLLRVMIWRDCFENWLVRYGRRIE